MRIPPAHKSLQVQDPAAKEAKVRVGVVIRRVVLGADIKVEGAGGGRAPCGAAERVQQQIAVLGASAVGAVAVRRWPFALGGFAREELVGCFVLAEEEAVG